MPTTLDVGDYLQVRIVCSSTSQTAVNVLYYRVASKIGLGVRDVDVADVLDTFWAPKYKSVLASNAQYEGVSVQRVTPNATDKVVDVTSFGGGDVAGDKLPPQISGLITLYTGAGGRRGRGRRFVGFPSEISNGPAGFPVTEYVTALQVVAEACHEIVNVSNGVVDSAVLHPVLYSGTADAYYRITSAVARQKWATQRSRSFFNRGDSTGL